MAQIMESQNVGAAFAIFKSGLGESFLTNPIFYFLIGLMLVAVPFIVNSCLGLTHRKKKQSAREMPKG
ncbi:MAG: hypothetical protein E6I97_22320 [Chloroflexi bacterium]|nr:MAG: hypothetical protein E6I97_22320 [Chloroflexota bacterium]